ncbi:hypothetical protein CSC82_28055 [Rhodobacteraceae bacterium 4F10]|nr:hypothetical protein CSC82_28055 [Rhodobacteraceae bacterium 4F10]
MVDFTRKITHEDYKNSEKLKKYYHRVVKKIHTKPRKFKKRDYKKSQYRLVDDNFVASKSGSIATFQIGGGVSLLLLLGTLRYLIRDGLNNEILFLMILSAFLTIFFVIYGFTMPKKEHILNRKDGLITMTGFFWQKNITMLFKKAEFAYSTGGEDGVGGFMLQTIRPNKWKTFDIYTIFGGECYEDMSFITWYMDKNRPLPPGEAFNPYRQQDFERRKAEGFPKPLYSSKISTPEATKEQQAERKRIGGW